MSTNLEGDLNGDGIIDEMDRVRSDLGGEIDQLGVQMRSMFDWQAYVRSAPLTSAAAAVVLGILLAPRVRSRPVPVAAEGFGPASSGFGGGISGMLTSTVLGGLAKAGSVYLAELLTRQLKSSSLADDDSEPPESAQPF